MTFEAYCKLIEDSVAENGYDNFHPSLYTEENEEPNVKVLFCELTVEGEFEPTINWAYQFFREGKTTYVAYREPNRIVRIMEILGRELINDEYRKIQL